jgi:uncharacterized protein (UPF0548 family)
MILLHRPSPAEVDAYLARAAGLPFSYAEVGATRDAAPPAGYVSDHRRLLLGFGEQTFDAACACLRRWDMFDLGWVSLCWPRIEPIVGATVAPAARFFGAWWLNACRVVYVEGPTPSSRRLRFAYGTLSDHAERGEERFTVEQLDDGTVWYDLYAFSRPNHWLARLGYPLARQMQWRFGRGSLAAMARAVRRELSAVPARAIA